MSKDKNIGQECVCGQSCEECRTVTSDPSVCLCVHTLLVSTHAYTRIKRSEIFPFGLVQRLDIYTQKKKKKTEIGCFLKQTNVPLCPHVPFILSQLAFRVY